MKKILLILSLLISALSFAEIPSGYYNDAADKTGDALKDALHGIIHDHTRLSYDAVWEALMYTDEDTANSSNVLLLYSGWSYPKSSNGGGTTDWNREHTWAKSQGDFGTSKGAGTDIHHLRPTDVTVNSARGSMKFDEGGTIYVDGSRRGGGDATTACRKGSDNWEPADGVKGDVARMLFYMATCYEAEDGVDLELAESSSTSGKHGKLSTLLLWHEQDPVSAWEIRRNNRAYEKQGNRNPFIDHPEYVCHIWGDGDCDTTTAGGDTGNGGEETPDTADVTINMSTADYQLIVDYVKNSDLPDGSTYDDSEYYYGASSHYTNFDIRDGKCNSKFATPDEAIVEALRDVFLPAKVESSLLNVDYIVNYATWDGSSNGTGTKTFHCSATDPLAFTLGAATQDPVDTTNTDTTVVIPEEEDPMADLSFGTDSTLDVVTWNIEHFPKNTAITDSMVRAVVYKMDADIVAVQEVDDSVAFRLMVEKMPDYKYHAGVNKYGALAYLYNVNTVEVNSVQAIYESYWSEFPRSPLVFDFNFKGQRHIIINNHLKCCGDGTLDTSNDEDEENRRLKANDLLKTYIDGNYADLPVITVGDFNDVLEDVAANNVFQNFIDDSRSYEFADMAISLGSSDNWSYPSWPSDMDHILVTNELFGQYEAEVIKVDDYIGWDNYEANLSDHRPVGIRIALQEEVEDTTTTEPEEQVFFNFTFDNDLEECVVKQVSGNAGWEYSASYSCAFLNTYGDGANESWLVTPSVNMNATANEVLSFGMTSYNANISIANAGSGQFELYYSSSYDGGDINASGWTRLTDVDNVMLGERWAWVEVTVDVSEVSGSQVYFAFRHSCDASSGTTWEFDNLKLIGDVVTGNAQLPMPEIMLYPNPANSGFSLSKDADMVQLFTLSGKSVIRETNVMSGQFLDIAHLPAGIYMLNATISGNTQRLKLIKK